MPPWRCRWCWAWSSPQSSGLGGGGFLLYYDAASRTISVYDGRETAPAGATPTMFLGANAKPLSFREAAASGMSVGVPGAVALLELAHKDHGKRPWAELFAPAIALAQNGFAVSPRLAAWLALIKSFANDPEARSIYFTADGAPHKQDDHVVNPALADTLRLVADKGSKATILRRARSISPPTARRTSRTTMWSIQRWPIR